MSKGPGKCQRWDCIFVIPRSSSFGNSIGGCMMLPPIIPGPISWPLVPVGELDKLIASLPNINTIPDARKLLSLAQGYMVSARKLYRAVEVATINEANEDKDKSHDIAKKAGELRLYAEARLGELIKSEQEAGRLQGQGGDRKIQTNNVVSLKDYGITWMESSRAQELAEHQDIIAKVIVESMDIPTRNAVLKEIKAQEYDSKKEDAKNTPIPVELYNVFYADPDMLPRRDLAAAGWSYARIGRVYKMSRQAVRAIVLAGKNGDK